MIHINYFKALHIFICVILIFSISSCGHSNDTQAINDLNTPYDARVIDDSSNSDDIKVTDDSELLTDMIRQEFEDVIAPQNEFQYELVENCRYIGMTLAELEAIFGRLIPEKCYEGARGFQAQLSTTNLVFCFEVAENAVPEADDCCVALAGALNSLIPTFEGIITSEQFNEMLNASVRCYENEVYEYMVDDITYQEGGDYGVFGFFDPLYKYIMSEYYDELNKALWDDSKSMCIFIDELKNNDEIKPDSLFSLTIKEPY